MGSCEVIERRLEGQFLKHIQFVRGFLGWVREKLLKGNGKSSSTRPQFQFKMDSGSSFGWIDEL